MKCPAFALWLALLSACSNPSSPVQPASASADGLAEQAPDAAAPGEPSPDLESATEPAEQAASNTPDLPDQAAIPKFLPEELRAWQACKKDADCAVVSNGCCGDDLEAVNQRMRDKVRAHFKCPQGCPKSRLPALSVAEARCVKRACVVRYVSTGKEMPAPTFDPF